MAAVELHLTSGGVVDDVIALVEAALDDVKNRRSNLITEYNTKVSDLETLK